MQKEDLCPCQSGKAFGECCAPIIDGSAKAETAEALMRARYTSYVTGDIIFLKSSWTSSQQELFDEKAYRNWSKSTKWHGLEIISTERGGKDDDEGLVEFRALYSSVQDGQFCNHHELSKFIRENGEWKFLDGEMLKDKPLTREEPKVGRNDPCPCGSGKKYKKCCGRES